MAPGGGVDQNVDLDLDLDLDLRSEFFKSVSNEGGGGKSLTRSGRPIQE